MRTRLGLAIGVVAAAVFTVAHAPGACAAGRGGASNEQLARQHFLAGKHAFEANHYARALHEFQDGYALEPRPGFLLNMGHAARRLGQPREARDFYVRFLATRPPPAEQRAAAQMVAEIDRDLWREPSRAAAARSATTVTPPAAAVGPPLAVAEHAAPAVASEPAPAVVADPPAAVSPAPVVAARAADLRAPAPAAEAPSPATTLAASALAPRESSSGPIYQRWWFWAGAGAVAAGVLAAVLVAASGGSAARDNGSWGQLRL